MIHCTQEKLSYQVPHMASDLFFPLSETVLPLLVLGHHAVKRHERPTFVVQRLQQTHGCDHATVREIAFVYCKLERFRPDMLGMQTRLDTTLASSVGMHIPSELLQCPKCENICSSAAATLDHPCS